MNSKTTSKTVKAKAVKVTDNKKAKIAVVKEIADKIKKSNTIIVAEYHGLSVSDISVLRSSLKKEKINLQVYKNNLVKLALKGTKFEDLGKKLTGPNVFAFGMGEDDIAPAKMMVNFAKEHEALDIKAGVYEGKVISKTEVLEVASLPTMNEALTMLATSMMAPVRFMGVGLNMIAEKGLVKAE